jgi:hypothetical protein
MRQKVSAFLSTICAAALIMKTTRADAVSLKGA